MKYLLKNGFLHGDRITCTGKTVAENLEAFDDLTPGQKVIMPLENPKRADGPLIILKGNLAPEGAVAKVSGLKFVTSLVLLKYLTQKKMPSKQFFLMKSLMAM